MEIADLVAMTGSFAVAAWIAVQRVEPAPLAYLLAVKLRLTNFVLFLLLLVVWHLTFKYFGLYRLERLTSSSMESWSVLKATSMGSMTILTASFLVAIDLVTPLFVPIFWLSSTSATILIRLVFRRSLSWLRMKGQNLRHMLIVGTNPRARRFAQKIRSRPDLGYTLVGFVDEEWTGLEDFRSEGLSLVSGLDDLLEFLRRNVVDEVVIALPMASAHRQAARIVAQCEKQGILVRVLSDLFNLSLAHSRLDLFEDEPVLTLETGRMQGGSVLVKRLLDFSIALLLLLLLTPLLLIVALLIKVTSTGPVFFVQQRVGLGKRLFSLLKFRTMETGAEERLEELEHLNEVEGPVFKIREDPRITPLGKILRTTSVDELPQLINVLLGDMSLVGPRPLPVRDYEGFDTDWHRRRFSVRPGITCLWQVSGRSSLPFERWMELDMKYIDEWSLWLDLKILVKTVPAVLRGSGAA